MTVTRDKQAAWTGGLAIDAVHRPAVVPLLPAACITRDKDDSLKAAADFRDE
jgi:hypothetical protein